MDFDDTPAEAAYRERARAWLAANAAQRDPRADRSSRHLGEAEKVARARGWQRRKAAAGYAAVALPASVGGGGGTAMEQVIFAQEEARFDVPFGVYEIGLGMCLPTIEAVGDDEQKGRFLPPGIRGDEIWCQLFSEPGAGSDVAALQTRAERHGDEWVITGQKIWTTGAQFSDYGLLLARTHPDRPKHEGLTMFLVDMKAPGVTVRPIRQMDDQREFNEVFFDELRTPDAWRLGEPGQGWRVALTTLMFERFNVGADLGLVDWRTLLEVLPQLRLVEGPALEDGRARDALARAYTDTEGLRLIKLRTLSALSRGEPPGPEQAMGKLVGATTAQALANLALELQGPAGALTEEELGPDWTCIVRSWWVAPALRIAGGTDEILRNIIAERVLGLPPEPRFDKTKPFAERGR